MSNCFHHKMLFFSPVLNHSELCALRSIFHEHRKCIPLRKVKQQPITHSIHPLESGNIFHISPLVICARKETVSIHHGFASKISPGITASIYIIVMFHYSKYIKKYNKNKHIIFLCFICYILKHLSFHHYIQNGCQSGVICNKTDCIINILQQMHKTLQ